MQIYINDKTLNPPKDIFFTDYKSVVRYLEGMVQRETGHPRKNYMLFLESVGHGGDDSDSVNFVRSMSERFDIGIIREGRRMRCDITAASMYNKPEYGS